MIWHPPSLDPERWYLMVLDRADDTDTKARWRHEWLVELDGPPLDGLGLVGALRSRVRRRRRRPRRPAALVVAPSPRAVAAMAARREDR